MNEALEFLVKHKGRSALIDANLLLTYLVGKTDRRSLSKLKYTKQYEGDFELIERVVESFSVIYTTPNVLTEVSNLGKGLGPRFFQTLGKAVNVLKEEYFDSKT